MNNMFFSQKKQKNDENVFFNQNFNSASKPFPRFFNDETSSKIQVNQNRAQSYYPEILTVQENSASQKEETFDINDISQFQQDFSYLQNSNFQGNHTQNEEKSQKNALNSQNSEQNNQFFEKNINNLNSDGQNSTFSSENDNLFSPNFDKNNNNKKNNQKNGLNFENIMQFLKNGSQPDLFATMLSSGVFKNQNPVMVETLSKMLSQKKQETTQHIQCKDTDYFEEM